MKRYPIKLTKIEAEGLHKIINKGSYSSKKFRIAYILLNCNEELYFKKASNKQISMVLKVSMKTIDRVKKRFVEEGLEAVLERRPTKRIYHRKLNDDMEAKLVALCCSKPPKGITNWSLRLLAKKMIELRYVENISHITVRRVLKTMNLSHKTY